MEKLPKRLQIVSFPAMPRAVPIWNIYMHHFQSAIKGALHPLLTNCTLLHIGVFAKGQTQIRIRPAVDSDKCWCAIKLILLPGQDPCVNYSISHRSGKGIVNFHHMMKFSQRSDFNIRRIEGVFFVLRGRSCRSAGSSRRCIAAFARFPGAKGLFFSSSCLLLLLYVPSYFVNGVKRYGFAPSARTVRWEKFKSFVVGRGFFLESLDFDPTRRPSGIVVSFRNDVGIIDDVACSGA
mmetsp:Transcript_14262/g.29952  ORF Transcript_14262/g.29952 Transcript_14262/m.29952 type:complete len:236 (+) Transcript_14262:2105-2812(+)